MEKQKVTEIDKEKKDKGRRKKGNKFMLDIKKGTTLCVNVP
jgi:hypothetical protein